MMMKSGMTGLALAGLVLPMSLAGQTRVATPAAEPPAPQSFTALSTLSPGQWTLRGLSRTSGNRAICLGDSHALLQIRHGAASCSRFVIAKDARGLTVHYTCPGAGHGRTTIHVESSALVRIETQGIVNNAPFDASWEARRTGECSAKSPSLVH
jgi:hypothetical protein